MRSLRVLYIMIHLGVLLDRDSITLTRTDLAFSINKVCQFMNSPSKNQWDVVNVMTRGTLKM